MQCDRQCFVILSHFCPFNLLATPKTKIWKKYKKTWMYPLTHVYIKLRSYDGWFLRYKVPHGQGFCHFGPFFAFLPFKILKKWKKSLDQFTVLYPKWQSYDVWLLRYGVQQTEFFVILDYFLPFYPLKTQGKNFLKQNKKNRKTKTTTTKKTPGDIILHMCTINENHMIHGSWDMECNKQPEK